MYVVLDACPYLAGECSLISSDANCALSQHLGDSVKVLEELACGKHPYSKVCAVLTDCP